MEGFARIQVAYSTNPGCCDLRSAYVKERIMAVQQNKKSPSKRGMHRAHDFLTNPPLAIEPTTGEVHLRHHVSPSGYYRGKKVAKGTSE